MPAEMWAGFTFDSIFGRSPEVISSLEIQNYCGSGLYASSGIPDSSKHNVSETVSVLSVSFLR
jgi:hypothetical protein